eukprot:gene52-4_t
MDQEDAGSKVAESLSSAMSQTNSQGAFCMDAFGLIIAQVGELPQNPSILAQKALSRQVASMDFVNSEGKQILAQSKDGVTVVLVGIEFFDLFGICGVEPLKFLEKYLGTDEREELVWIGPFAQPAAYL